MNRSRGTTVVTITAASNLKQAVCELQVAHSNNIPLESYATHCILNFYGF